MKNNETPRVCLTCGLPGDLKADAACDRCLDAVRPIRKPFGFIVREHDLPSSDAVAAERMAARYSYNMPSEASNEMVHEGHPGGGERDESNNYGHSPWIVGMFLRGQKHYDESCKANLPSILKYFDLYVDEKGGLRTKADISPEDAQVMLAAGVRGVAVRAGAMSPKQIIVDDPHAPPPNIPPQDDTWSRIDRKFKK